MKRKFVSEKGGSELMRGGRGASAKAAKKAKTGNNLTRV